MKLLHSIPVESIAPITDSDYVWANVGYCTTPIGSIWHVSDPTLGLRGLLSDDHHGCVDNFLGGDSAYCECTRCSPSPSGILHYFSSSDWDDNGMYICESCLNGKCPARPEGLVWHE